jgi:hypothetical protein
MAREADELRAELFGVLPGDALDSGEIPSPAPSRQRLPSKCPHCGGTVVADSVEWIDTVSAICDYCGSVLSAEG